MKRNLEGLRISTETRESNTRTRLSRIDVAKVNQISKIWRKYCSFLQDLQKITLKRFWAKNLTLKQI